MSDLVVETRGLRKVFRDGRQRLAAVDGLDLAVERGGVHGFLGPNGSGKTTTIRMLLGLARPDAGDVRVLGEPLPDRLPDVLRRGGAGAPPPGGLPAVRRGGGAVAAPPRSSPALPGRRTLLRRPRRGGRPGPRGGGVRGGAGRGAGPRPPPRRYSYGMLQRLGLAA